MKIIRDFFENELNNETAVTVGKFDGFHRGHELLLDKIRSSNRTSLVVTFDVSPRFKISDIENNYNLITLNERLQLLLKEDVDNVLICDFNDRFMNTEPEEFIRILVERYSMKELYVGTDFVFGKRGSGNIELLEKLSKKYDFELTVIDKLKEGADDISSSRVRKLIKEGDIKSANNLLGYEFFIWGEILHGKKLGRKMGIPTINILPEDDKLLPKFGVYLTKVYVDNKEFCGVTNIGVRPTLDDGDKPTVETNILNFEDEIYGEKALIKFLEFVRPEMKFDSVLDLQRQIEKDKQTAEKFFIKP
jgi:riboflavin kinase/FMN adenylyltransferase